jgi:uncharacterized membrane protein
MIDKQRRCYGNVAYIIGQILSILAVVVGFIAFQMKTPKKMLALQIATGLIFSAHYLLIGAMTASVLNLISAIKYVCYYIRDKRQKKTLFAPIFFTVLVIISSILTWDSWWSMFIMVGLVINTVSFAIPNAQLIRKLNLIKSPLCLIYNIAVLSIGGIFYESFTLISSIIGIIINREKQK